MTHPTNGPTNAPGTDDPNSCANKSADSSNCSTHGASSDGSPGGKLGVDRPPSDGSRAPGSLPEGNLTDECCGSKSTSSGDKEHFHAPREVTSPKGLVDSSLASPATASAPWVPDSVSKSPSPPVYAESNRLPAPADAESSRRDTVSPQDPKQFGRNDPIQPNRPEPAQPSYVSEPVIGGASGIGDGDEAS